MLNSRGGIILGFPKLDCSSWPKLDPGVGFGRIEVCSFPMPKHRHPNSLHCHPNHSVQCCTVSWTRAALTHVEGELCHSCFAYIVLWIRAALTHVEGELCHSCFAFIVLSINCSPNHSAYMFENHHDIPRYMTVCHPFFIVEHR